MVKEQATQPQKILILAAIPHGLRLDKEMREVEECIRRAVRRDIFDVDIRTAVRPQDIRRAIAEEKPTIVHFCGHGLEDGSLLLEDNGGQNKVVPPEGLASLFELHADYVNCVLLNACHSVKSAEAISKYINYAIGMNQEIQDQSAIQFAQGFYDGLGYATSKIQDVFPRAFQEGLVAIKLESLSQAEIPVIKTRINIDKPHKPMDISLLVRFLTPCLPFLLNVGNKAVEGASQKLGEDVWRKATVVWSKLQPKVEGKAAALEAAKDVANDPEDEDLQTALRVQLKKILEGEPTLAAEIAQILSEKSITGTDGDNIQQDVSGTGNQVIGKMDGNAKAIGRVHGNVNM
ncbi:CHAT domain-containing protein [Nostoc sp. GT001]|uniref:CHAT domain-containing protein n=1 Tax=Nostoc sp. GT001 TaxID=3056647 RepID=UPI0025AA6E50|nr:CHAT domain-containing protein [Nostoc sp. GT001]MDM9583670.1 CHAT domain-containing protein [Nostoc sp. GT001]